MTIWQRWGFRKGRRDSGWFLSCTTPLFTLDLCYKAKIASDSPLQNRIGFYFWPTKNSYKFNFNRVVSIDPEIRRPYKWHFNMKRSDGTDYIYRRKVGV